MLNKDICKQCCLTHRLLAGNARGWWSGYDEQNWKKGLIECPVKFAGKTMDVGSPPRKCAYSMEHLVLGQEGFSNAE